MGASATIWNNKDDFVGEIKPLKNMYVNGLGNLKCEELGEIKLKLTDDSGKVRYMHVKNTFYILDCPMKLLSPQQLIRQSSNKEARLEVRKSNCILHWDGFQKTVSYHPGNQLPILYSIERVPEYGAFLASCERTPNAHINQGEVDDDDPALLDTSGASKGKQDKQDESLELLDKNPTKSK